MKDNNKLGLGAIDLGFGNTKFSTGFLPDGSIHGDLFQSIVTPVSKTDARNNLMEDRNTAIVEVDGAFYEVGPDAHITKNNDRVLHEDYVNHPNYSALMKGALYYMGAKEIDVLVLGLPVSMHLLAPILKEKFTGEVKVNDSLTVKVNEVIVLDQPYGALIYYASLSDENRQRLEGRNNVVIDPGYFTYDWLYAHGFKKDRTRSDSHNSGISSILIDVAKSFGLDYDIPNYKDLINMDRGLRTGSAFLYGNPKPMEKYYPLVSSLAQTSINAMQNQIGNDCRDVDNFILAGGGSYLYEPGLRAAFPHHEILTIPDSVFANLKGYILRGHIYMESKKK